MIYRTAMTAPATGIRRELDRLVDETFGRLAMNAPAATAWVPALDVAEDDEGLLLEFEVPGVSPDDIEITSEKGILSIRGEKRSMRQRDGVRPVISERGHGRFTRSIQLPQGIDDSVIDAEYADGILRVRIPRAAMPQPRRVQVRVTPATRETNGQ